MKKEKSTEIQCNFQKNQSHCHAELYIKRCRKLHHHFLSVTFSGVFRRKTGDNFWNFSNKKHTLVILCEKSSNIFWKESDCLQEKLLGKFDSLHSVFRGKCIQVDVTEKSLLPCLLCLKKLCSIQLDILSIKEVGVVLNTTEKTYSVSFQYVVHFLQTFLNNV